MFWRILAVETLAWWKIVRGDFAILVQRPIKWYRIYQIYLMCPSSLHWITQTFTQLRTQQSTKKSIKVLRKNRKCKCRCCCFRFSWKKTNQNLSKNSPLEIWMKTPSKISWINAASVPDFNMHLQSWLNFNLYHIFRE